MERHDGVVAMGVALAAAFTPSPKPYGSAHAHAAHELWGAEVQGVSNDAERVSNFRPHRTDG
ncbi:hypothetical protein ABZ208_16705 [Streptomyces sp. NPDC006208]|uniref:hypothetical protein n=1 Tax=Streptomyces sp. NPDC006208 TaxID=3156734 RepID=UPI0033A65FC4